MLLSGLFLLTHGLVKAEDEGLMGEMLLRRVSRTVNETLLNVNNTINQTRGGHGQTDKLTNGQAVAQAVAAGDSGTGVDNKYVFAIGILVSVCVFAVLGVVMTVVCWVKISRTRKAGPDEGGDRVRTKDTASLDKRNMRDVQLSEYEKRKRQMMELDDQPDELPENEIPDSDDGGDLDEITAVQSQPLEEETIVNPNFIHHYLPRQGSMGRVG